MQKIWLFFGAIFWLVFLSNSGYCQKKSAPVQPDSTAEQVLSKPNLKKVPAQKLIDVLGQALQQDQNEQQRRESNLGYEIDGLIVDETITKTGRDYYDIFYSNWEAPQRVNNYSVVIRERPSRGRGFQIVIEVNEEEISEMNLQPQFDMVEAAALDGVARTQGYLYNYENLKKQLDEDELRATELF